MRRYVFKVCGMAFFMFFITACSSDDLSGDQEINREVIIPKTKSIETEILFLINDFRESNRLNGLRLEPSLKFFAQEHNFYMIDKRSISHENFGTRSKDVRIYTGAVSVTENVGFSSNENPSTIVQAWQASDSHRAAMLGDFNYFELSAEQDENGNWYFTNIFIRK